MRQLYTVLFSHYSNVDLRWDYSKVYYVGRSPVRAARGAVARMMHKWVGCCDKLKFRSRRGGDVTVSVYNKNGTQLYINTVNNMRIDILAQVTYVNECATYQLAGRGIYPTCDNVPHRPDDCDHCYPYNGSRACPPNGC